MYVLDGLLETVPESLVDDVTRKRLRVAGDLLPDALAEVTCLEARLHEDPRVDLLLLARAPRQLAVLAGTDPNIRLAGALADQPAWQGAARLARRSARLTLSGSGVFPGIWMEFDLEVDGKCPTPGVFITTEPAPCSAEGANWDTAATVADILATATVPWDGGTDAVIQVVRRLVAHGLGIRAVGMFPGRIGSALRLYCTRVPEPDVLIDVLISCGWSGSQAQLRHWLGTCVTWCDRIYLDVDVTPDGLAPDIGIEATFIGRPPPSQEPRWGGLLAELTRAGLCTPAKRNAVEGLGASYSVELFTRRDYQQQLFHVKITVARDGSASAKVYFAANTAIL